MWGGKQWSRPLELVPAPISFHSFHGPPEDKATRSQCGLSKASEPRGSPNRQIRSVLRCFGKRPHPNPRGFLLGPGPSAWLCLRIGAGVPGPRLGPTEPNRQLGCCQRGVGWGPCNIHRWHLGTQPRASVQMTYLAGCSPFLKKLFWNNYRFTRSDKDVQSSPVQPSLSFPDVNILHRQLQYSNRIRKLTPENSHRQVPILVSNEQVFLYLVLYWYFGISPIQIPTSQEIPCMET